MTVYEAFAAMLNADPTVSSLQGQGIKPWPLAQQWTSPAGAYHGVSTVPDYPLKGRRFDTTTVIQLDVQATGNTAYGDARALANAVTMAVESWAPATPSGITIHDAWINNDIDDYEEDTLVYRIILDCAVLWS